MTEIAVHQPQTDLTQQMDYARVVADGSLLPDTYRNKPANVLIAVGLGQAMGLSPAESLYRIDVIQGKPTASAELIAANVRRAGHRLRVKVTEEPPSATCTIIRCDDPDEPTVITRNMAWAQRMGLVNKDNYKKQPSTMLSWRAISACARLACPEALYGVAYTPDEMYDDGGARPPQERPATAGLGAALAAQQETPEPETPEGITDGANPPAEDVSTPSTPGSVTPGQIKKIGAAMREVGLTDRKVALEYVADITGRAVESRNDLSQNEASQVIDALQRDIDDRNAASADKETGEIVDAEVVDEPALEWPTAAQPGGEQ